MKESNFILHARREFEILKQSCGDNECEKPIILRYEKEIYDILKKVSKEGLSGGSAPYYASIISNSIKHLIMFETMSPLTGEDNEWNDISDYCNGKKSWQNNRNSAVFKWSNGKYTYNDAVIFKNQNGICYSGSAELPDGSSFPKLYIKSFPFEPKTFYIDVYDWEVDKDDENIEKEGSGWWRSRVVDVNQLKEVFEYYDKE